MFKDEVICYVINLDRDIERWNKILQDFESIGITPNRVSAVWGKDHMDSPLFSQRRFFYAKGRNPLPAEIGCCLSHYKTLELFLQSDKEYALICEDDAVPLPQFVRVVEEAMRYRSSWDLLRLNGTRSKTSWPYRKLTDQYKLCTTITGMTSSTIYMVNRRAAKILAKKLVPFFVPADDALHRGWFGVREASILPWIAGFNEYTANSTIGRVSANTRITQLSWWSCRCHRIYVRFIRYYLQLYRTLRRSLLLGFGK